MANLRLEEIKEYDVVVVRYNHQYGGQELGPEKTMEVERTGYVHAIGEFGIQLTTHDSRLIDKLPEIFRPSDILQTILLENLVSITKLSEK